MTTRRPTPPGRPLQVTPHDALEPDTDYMLWLVDMNDPRYKTAHGVHPGRVCIAMVARSTHPHLLEFTPA